MSLEDIKKRGRFWCAYLNQDQYWLPNDKPKILVLDMDSRWRQNAANWLLKRAFTIEMYYTMAELDRLYAPRPVVIGEHNGKPIEVGGIHATSLAPYPGSMAEDAFNAELDERSANPEEWLKSMPLYKALLDMIQYVVSSGANNKGVMWHVVGQTDRTACKIPIRETWEKTYEMPLGVRTCIRCFGGSISGYDVL